MRKALKFAVVLLLGTTAVAIAQFSAPTTSATPTDDVARLIQQLGNDRFAERQAAELGLIRLGRDAVPQLRQTLATTEDAEVRARLRRAIERITTLRWHRDLPTAYAEARAYGKSVLVFSTIGESNGYS